MKGSEAADLKPVLTRKGEELEPKLLNGPGLVIHFVWAVLLSFKAPCDMSCVFVVSL
jgi:hypothetical protein